MKDIILTAANKIHEETLLNKVFQLTEIFYAVTFLDLQSFGITILYSDMNI